MPDWDKLPVRVRRTEAIRLLAASKKTFPKIVDANPQLKHRLPGEVHFTYLTAEIRKLLTPVSHGVRPAGKE